MKNLKRFFLFLICAAVAFSVPAAGLSAQDPQTQNQATALMRGYRTGYSDGYQAGVNDTTSSAPREFRTKAEYEHADRAYNSNYGALEEYRVVGVKTSIPFHLRVLSDPVFLSGQADTTYVDRAA